MSTTNELPKAATSDASAHQTFRFIDYKVYQDSKYWFQEITSLKGILDTNTELWIQIKINITSVLMNITSSSTKLPKDAKKYLGNAITAANKVVACLDLACDVQALSPEEFQLLSNGFKDVIIQLKRMIKSLGSPKTAETPEVVATA